MRLVSEVGLALRLLGRDYRAGELTLIALAIVIAVASVTTVGFFTDRVQRALDRQANRLLGSDLVVSSDRPLAREFEAEAFRSGLAVARVMRFPSVVVSGEKSLLADVKVVSPGYPLRGEARIASEPYGADHRAESVPAPGTAWVDERLLAGLDLKVGDEIRLGARGFTVAAIVTHEPDAVIGFLSAAPRLLVNEGDIAATGLIQPGSRIRYRLQVAGPSGRVEPYRAWARARLAAGMRIEGIGDTRPEVKAALERAGRFTNLAALVSVVLAAVAIALAARRFLQRHLDGCAMMRCLGASQALITRLYVVHFVLLGAVASAIGCVVGVGAQSVLAQWMRAVVNVDLPPLGWLPALHGLAAGLLLLLGFVLPPLVSLARVSTLRVLRREMGVPTGRGLAGYALGLGVIGGMILWRAQDLTLGAVVLGGFVAATLAAGALAWGVLRGLGRLRESGVSWRFGIANLQRRPLGSVIQVVALGLGIMALLTLTLVRTDLLRVWQKSVPPDAPNRFIVNIQPEQAEPLARFFAARGLAPPGTFPMVRGRLIRINDRAVSSADYAEERARHLIDREFNLSWATRLQADNRIVAGEWWGVRPGRPEQFSVEEGVAERLGIRLGDVLTYDVAGSPVAGRVSSLRKVEWDTFNVNFFVIAPPGLLEGFPVSYVTSFYSPPRDVELVNAVIRAFPNFLVIDVAQVMRQVQRIMDQVARAVQFVFLFTLAAGLIVLYAAIAATGDERLYQATIMRTLGANRGQLARANLAEFAAIGALAGLVAAAGANALGVVLAARVLHLTYSFNAAIWVIGILLGAVGVAAAGYFGTRRVLKVAPLKVLRQLG